MHTTGGVALIATGTSMAMLVVFLLWRRLPERAALALTGACGAAVGAGALLVQDRASAGEWALAVGALVVLMPLHARLLFGRPGRPE